MLIEVQGEIKSSMLRQGTIQSLARASKATISREGGAYTRPDEAKVHITWLGVLLVRVLSPLPDTYMIHNVGPPITYTRSSQGTLSVH